MPVFRLPEAHMFPDPRLAEPSGLLAVGGDLHPDRVLLAYEQGIFPWFSQGEPVLWWSPDPRMVLRTDALKVSRSLKKRIRRGEYEVRFDTAFEAVVRACAEVPRPDQDGTWITEEMVAAYVALHEAGVAHSVEAWREGELVGGLYGVSVGRLFCGESMFARASDASKVCLVALVERLRRWNMPLVDCQVYTEHLARFGAEEVSREAFLGAVASLVSAPGGWGCDVGAEGAP